MEEFKGFTNYPGNVKGSIIKHVESIRKYKNPVLYCDNFIIDHIAFLPSLKAVIIRNKNFLSHAAIICREMKKPSVVGVEIEKIEEGDEVIIKQDNNKAISKVIIKRKNTKHL